MNCSLTKLHDYFSFPKNTRQCFRKKGSAFACRDVASGEKEALSRIAMMLPEKRKRFRASRRCFRRKGSAFAHRDDASGEKEALSHIATMLPEKGKHHCGFGMIKIRRNRLLFCFFPYFCDRIKATCIRTYLEIKEALCLSCSLET